MKEGEKGAERIEGKLEWGKEENRERKEKLKDMAGRQRKEWKYIGRK